MISGSSRLTARPMRLGLEVDAGAARRGDAELPGEGARRWRRRCRRSRPRPARCARRSSCACDSSCRMSDAGVIGYDARNSGSFASCAGGDQAPGQRGVAGDVAVRARAEGRPGLTSYGWLEQLGRLAEVVPGLERGECWRRAPSRSWPNRSSIHSTIGSIGRVYIQTIRPSAKKFFERSASRGLAPGSFDGLDGDRRHRHLVRPCTRRASRPSSGLAA